MCDHDVDSKTSFLQHMKDHSEDLKRFRFSNNTVDYCKSACKLCGEAFPLSRMREHTKKRHDMVITEYKKKFNQSYYDIIEKVFHKCGICELPLIFDSDVIATHLRVHSITHKEYNLKYVVTQQSGGAVRAAKRKSEGEESSQKVAEHSDISTKTSTHLNTKTNTEKNTMAKMDENKRSKAETGAKENIEGNTKSSMNLNKKTNTENQESQIKSQKASSIDDVRKTNVVKNIGHSDTLTKKLKPVKVSRPLKFPENSVDTKSSNQEVETNLDKIDESSENIKSIESFRNFIALITDPGRDPVSYPAIERILGMDTSSEEAIVEAAAQFCST